MTLYRYTFAPDLPQAEVETALVLSVIAVEGLHGEAQTRLDGGDMLGHAFGPRVIDASTPAGRDLAKVFTAVLRRAFGEDSFRVERVHPIQPQPANPEVRQ